MTWAYSDESERAATMYFGVLLIEPFNVLPARRALRGLLLPGQRRVHTAKESRTRRSQLIGLVAGLDVEVVVWSLQRPRGLSAVQARELLVREAAGLVLEKRVARWQIDNQEPNQAARDRSVIDHVLRDTEHVVVYDHTRATGDPLLWAIDAALWAVAAGGDWKRRVDHRVRVVRLTP